jgi:putative transposase
MSRSPLAFQLKAKDTKALDTVLGGGVQQVRVVMRAMALFQLGRGLAAPVVAEIVRLTPQAVRRIAHRYLRDGLDAALYDRPRPGAVEILTAGEKQRIVALVCSDPPTGAARWTVRLLAEEVVKLKVVARVGRETIRVLLQSHDLKPWREKNVVRG